MKIALGTAQFGYDYGVTNTEGKVSRLNCRDILNYAKASSISMLDTASSYGESELILGEIVSPEYFMVVSKVSSLQGASPGLLKDRVYSSLARLRRENLYGLLMHDENDLLGANGDEYFSAMSELKRDGIVAKVGVSFYSVESALDLLMRYDLDIIQIPASQLDRRFEHGGILKIAKDRGVEVHARSIFLQGLLLVDAAARPLSFHGFEALGVFDVYVKRLGLTPLQFALLYIVSMPQIDYATVGCVSAAQLNEIVEAYEFCLNANIPCPDISTSNTSLINPTAWGSVR
jgi:aryl-alcohol dehydrogenase-like predicted oxidoreductase